MASAACPCHNADNRCLRGTVRIRKVKCDEGRPACNRCVSTGRVCDGYGIWGGGGNFYGHRQRSKESKDIRVVPRPPASVAFLAFGAEEEWCFEWFKWRVPSKLPGSFPTGFWTTLLLQAGLNEPAVLHAILALSSVHRRGTLGPNCQRNIGFVPDCEEQFTLQHYVKSIGHLQSHLSSMDRASSRVALITCVVFISLEFLRGHFKTAQMHIQNGVNMLREMQLLSTGKDGILQINPFRGSTDDWIAQAFSRLSLQLELFKHNYHHSPLLLQAPEPEVPILVFQSINEAWQQVHQLLNRAFYLTHRSRAQAAASECEHPSYHSTLLRHQQRVRTELAQWLDVYEASEGNLQGRRSVEEERVYLLVRTYHTMASIMTETSLQPDNESRFDSQTDQFVLLIKQLGELWMPSMTIPTKASPGHQWDMSTSIVDIGWIPPLYYAAVKCRVHRVRIQAIRLLESASHREGIWDSRTAASVSRKVMEIEEGSFYENIAIEDEFALISPPLPQDLLLPTLPQSHRICDVEVVMSGAPMDRILLFCKQREALNDRVLLSEYDVHLQRWADAT